jgi:hypothetical protein
MDDTILVKYTLVTTTQVKAFAPSMWLYAAYVPLHQGPHTLHQSSDSHESLLISNDIDAMA